MYNTPNEAMKVSAYSRSISSSSLGQHFCYLAEIVKADDSDAEAFRAHGSTTIGIEGSKCGIAINSNSPTALSLGGTSATINVPVSNSGGYVYTGKPDDFNLSYASNVTDPYAVGGQLSNMTTMYPPPDTVIDLRSYSRSRPIPNPLRPGHYTGTASIISGLPSGETSLNLEPNGDYFFDDFNVNVPVNGSNVSIIISPDAEEGSVQVTGQLNITAKSSGPFAGIAVGSASNRLVGRTTLWATFTGGASTTFQGAIYFPNSNVLFSGTSGTVSDTCGQIIGSKISMGGNINLIDTSPSCSIFDNAGTSIRRHLVRLIQ